MHVARQNSPDVQALGRTLGNTRVPNRTATRNAKIDCKVRPARLVWGDMRHSKLPLFLTTLRRSRRRAVLSLGLGSALLSMSAVASADDDIGTTPARKSAPASSPIAPNDQNEPKPANEGYARPPGDQPISPDSPNANGPSAPQPTVISSEGSRQNRDRFVATDPPGDWAVFHVGLRPHLGRFIGLGTMALARERTEQFYGVFSLSAIRNDAGTHVGLAQIALGRNLSDTFDGAMQLSLTENRARNFAGLTQTTLGYNRAGDMVGVLQLGSYNRSTEFHGGLQVGAYSRTDQAFGGIAQVGVYSRADRSFAGVTQVGGYAEADSDFSGLLQLGVASSVGTEMFETSEDGAKKNRFAGLAQISGSVANVDGNFKGVMQVSPGASWVSGEFTGLTQIGMLAYARDFTGLLQVGGGAVSRRSAGIQVGGAALAFEEHTGLQISGVGNYAKKMNGAQIGLANFSEDARGVQIGLFNHAEHLRGVQIGLVNHAEDGVLPWTGILNMGFGDGDGGGPDQDYSKQQKGAAAVKPTRRVW